MSAGRTLLCATGLLLAVPAQARERDFDIAAMPAAQSIPEFARQAGTQIIAPTDALAGLTTPRLRGRLDTAAALRQLIAGVPLDIASDDGMTIVLRAARPEPAQADIVVTGTRIQSRRIVRPDSVISISASELLARSGSVSLGDQLSLYPPLRSTFSQAASTALGTQASGQVGINLLDLRGLGPARTLVLINGRRVVSSTQLVSQPDTNTIPQALLERVDILTGGASAVYGADAIAGVVNFVLKQDFEGVRFDGEAGISARGDAATRQASLVVGRRLGDGRGNLALAAGYAARDGLRATARDFAATDNDFVTNPLAGQPGQPATIPVRDIRSLAVSAGGTLAYGAPFLRFAPDGRLVPADIGSAAFPAVGLSQGGDGTNRTAGASLLPSNLRYYGTLLGHFDLADGARLYGQIDAVWQRAEAFATPSVATLSFRRDNPFLSPQAGATLDGFGPTAGLGDLVLDRSFEDIATLSERNTRRTVRGLLGLRGDLGRHLRYDLSYGYGRTTIAKGNRGNIDLGRLRRAVDAVRDRETGVIACRTPGDGCVPIDIFGAGAPSAAARDDVTLATRSTGRFQQHLVSGFLAGDTGSLLRLGGGPVSFVAGLEFRRETTRYRPDARDAQGDTLVSAQRLVGAVEVFEAYGEATAPVVADVRGIHRLEIGGSLRASKYRLQGLGTKLTGGVTILYQPAPALSLRGSVQRAMRAPNITELFQPLIAGQASVSDPCDARFIGDGTPARRTNCAALGLPADFQTTVVPTRIRTLTGGNPNLDVERGRTLTFGVVVAPEAMPGLRVAVDYHDIDLKDAIAQPGTPSLSASTIAAGCVDVAGIANEYCPLVRRDSVTGAITDVRQFPINLTRLRARGIDFDIRWLTPLSRGVRLDTRLLATRVLTRDDFRAFAQPDYATRLAGTVTDPRWQATLASSLDLGTVSLFHRVRYLSSSYYRSDDVAFFESVSGLPPIDPNRRGPDFVKTGATVYNDIRLAAAIGRASSIYLGVDNLGNVLPPFSLTGAGQSGTQYDNVGRFVYAGVRIGI